MKKDGTTYTNTNAAKFGLFKYEASCAAGQNFIQLEYKRTESF